MKSRNIAMMILLICIVIPFTACRHPEKADSALSSTTLHSTTAESNNDAAEPNVERPLVTITTYSDYLYFLESPELPSQFVSYDQIAQFGTFDHFVCLSDARQNDYTYNIMLRIPFPDLSTTFRMAYIGHQTCRAVPDSDDQDGDGDTTETIDHITNPYFGLTYQSIGLITITNTSSEASEQKTMVHEFGHLYGAPDHYGVSQPSTDDIIASTGNPNFNADCIYGEHRNDTDIMEDLTICAGCRSMIEENLDLYDHG